MRHPGGIEGRAADRTVGHPPGRQAVFQRGQEIVQGCQGIGWDDPVRVLRGLFETIVDPGHARRDRDGKPGPTQVAVRGPEAVQRRGYQSWQGGIRGP